MWLFLIVFYALLIGGVSFSEWHARETIAEMVRGGADPIKARCAIKPKEDACKAKQ